MSARKTRVHPLLVDACRCRYMALCMTCRRWLRHHNTVTARRQQTWRTTP